MYGKIFSSLWQGSLVGRPADQLVFIYLIANSDSRGIVDIHPRVIAHATGLEIEHVEDALRRLEADDSESRSNENDGRRILRVDDHRAWGWLIVNHEKYMQLTDLDRTRELTRERVRRHRAKAKGNATVTDGNGSKRHTDTDTDTDTDADTSTEVLVSQSLDPSSSTANAGSELPPAPPAPAAASPTFLTIPTNRDGKDYRITEDDLVELQALYPAVDVREQIRTMRGWAIGNPKKRKTLAGMPRFVHAWLSKDQNRGGKLNGATPQGAPPDPEAERKRLYDKAVSDMHETKRRLGVK